MSGLRELARSGDTIVIETRYPGDKAAASRVEGVVLCDDFVTLDGARGYLVKICRDVRDGVEARERIGREICVPFDLGAGDWHGRIRLLDRASPWHQDAAEDGIAKPA